MSSKLGEAGDMEKFRAGDSVYHSPSRETWTVAYHDGDYIAWVGWPPGEAKTKDCTLVSRATDEEHRKLLEDMAKTNFERYDRRGDVARRQLFLLNEGYVAAGI